MKRGYTVCFRKAFGDAANTQTYIVRAFLCVNHAISGGGAKLLINYEEVITLCVPSFGVAVWLFL